MPPSVGPRSGETPILVELFRHNLWANSEMLRACGNVTADGWTATVPGTYGSLGHIVMHMTRAQAGYLRRLTGWQPGPGYEPHEDGDFPGVEVIRRQLAFTGERLIEVASDLSPDHLLELDYEGSTHEVAAWVILLQAAYHATEHRQQVATTLTSIGMEPPEPDFWVFWDAIQRGRVPR